MAKEMIVSVNGREKKIAILEDGVVTEFYIERGEENSGVVGNIYKGRVMRVLPGMQSAFVDIGLERDAFLYVSDFFDEEEEFERIVMEKTKKTDVATAEKVASERLQQARLEREQAMESLQERAEPIVKPLPKKSGDSEQPRLPQVRLDDEIPSDTDFAPSQNQVIDRDTVNDLFPSLTVITDFDEASASDSSKEQGESGMLETPLETITPLVDMRDTAPSQFINNAGSFERITDDEEAEPGEMFKEAFVQERITDQVRAIEFDMDAPTAFAVGSLNLSSTSGFERIDDGDETDQVMNAELSAATAVAQNGDEQSFSDEAQTAVGEAEETRPAARGRRGRGRAARGASKTESDAPETVESVEAKDAPTGSGRRRRGAGRAKTTQSQEANADAPLTDQTSDETGANETELPPFIEVNAAPTAAFSTEESAGNMQDETNGEPQSEDSPNNTQVNDSDSSTPRESSEQPMSDNDSIEDAEAGSTGNEPIEPMSTGDENVNESSSPNDAMISGDNEVSGDAAESGDFSDAVIDSDEADAEASVEGTLNRSQFAVRRGGRRRRRPVLRADGTEERSGEGEAGETGDEADDSDDLAENEVEEPTIAARPDNARTNDAGRSSDNRASDNRASDNGRANDGRNDNRRPNEGRAGGGRGGERSNERGGERTERAERAERGGERGERGGERGSERGDRNERSEPRRRAPTITDLLREGQEVLVQIAKEPIAKKGARITSHIALPGRFLVYMPTVEHVGVSRKIESSGERTRLRNLIQRIRNEEDVPSGGFIVRTAGIGIPDEQLRDDARYLVRTWLDIRKSAEKAKSPALAHQDLDLVQRILRDQLSEDFDAIRIDDEAEYLRTVEFVNRIQPKMVNRVKLYTRDAPILEAYNVQEEVDKAIKPRVWLRSGGYLVINQTEALVAIDVNTGKFVGKGTNRLEDTITKTNMEAVDEIARQVRLRDLGGIIVLDLIDMEDRRNRQKVLQALQEALQGDKSPTKVLTFNDFGLIVMTRKRVKQSLERTLCAPCHYCQGAGLIKSPQTIAYEVLAEARRLSRGMDDGIQQTTLRVHPDVAKALRTTERDVLIEIEDYLGTIDITADAAVHQEQFDFAFI